MIIPVGVLQGVALDKMPPAGVLQGVALDRMLPAGVLQGVALDKMPPAAPAHIACELLPLHGEPNSSPTVGEAALLASGGTVLQSLRSSEGGAAWDNKNPGILVEASGATVGALLL